MFWHPCCHLHGHICFCQINILIADIPATVAALHNTWTQLDISSAKLYSITSNTKAVVNALEKDVTIYWVVQSKRLHRQKQKEHNYRHIINDSGEVYLLTSYGSMFAFFMMGAAFMAIGMFI